MTSPLAVRSGETCGELEEHNAVGQKVSPRIHYFDWLRTIAVLGIVVYHSFMPFAGAWLISNEETSDLLHEVASLFETFGLALLFLVAGAGARFALQGRSTRAFLAERAKRLLVPFAVGAVVLVPPIYYILGVHDGTISVSLLEFLAGYPGLVWIYVISKLGPSPQILVWIGMHLWFLAWLFICSGLALPIFAFLASSVGRSWVDALARLARWRGATLLLAVPLALPRLALAALPSGETAWGLDVFASLVLFFLVGYLLYCDDRFAAAVRRDLELALVVALVGSWALWATGYSRWIMAPKTYGLMYFAMMSLVAITGWAWTVAVLGWGMRTGFMQRQLPTSVGEAALPIYILHYPILFGIAVIVLDWPLRLEAKLLLNEVLVVGVSLLVTAAVLRIPIVRPLLGLRPRGRGVMQSLATA